MRPQPHVAFISVPLEQTERAEYVATEQQLVAARRVLRAIPHMPGSFSEFLPAVAHLAEQDAGEHGRAAREYLDALGKRREIVANSAAKYKALTALASTIRDADGARVFTETVRAANHAINRLDGELSIEIITGETPRNAREDFVGALRTGQLDAVAAARVLDEGVDVPNANLGVVVSASRTRRQMIQRMGRVLRRKPPGIGADDLERDVGKEAMYARLNYLQWPRVSWLHRWVAARAPDAPDRALVEDPHYLEIERPPMPELKKPKRKKQQLLSTGDSPVSVVQADEGFALSCTGCGVLSKPVTFRWQVLNQTVECGCSEW